MSLGLAIPFFNEVSVLDTVVSDLMAALSAQGVPFRLALVDNGSTDGTSAALARHEDSPVCQIIHLPANAGYGGGIRAGLAALMVGPDIPTVLGWCHGDGQSDPAVIPELYRACQDGAMLAKTVRVARDETPARRFVGACYRRYLRAWGIRNRDVNGTPKLFRREALEMLAPESPAFFLDTEVVIGAEARGWSIFEKEIEWRRRNGGTSKVGFAAVIEGLTLPIRWRLAQPR